MMALLKWLLALALTVPLAFVGWLLARDPGRLSVRAWGWQIDTTLVLALALVALASGIALGSYWLLWRLPKRLLARRARNLVAQFHHGLEDLAGARYAKARRRLVAASAVPANAPLALLHAAQAAAALGDLDDALKLAERAQAHDPVNVAARVLGMQLKLDAGDLSQLDQLQSLGAQSDHPLPMEVLAQQLCARGRAQEALLVLAKLGKRGALTGALGGANGVGKQWAEMVRLGLRQAATKDELANLWNGLSEPERAQQDVVAIYTHAAVRLGQLELAEILLRAALKQAPSELLWQEYAALSDQLSPADSLDALKFVEKMLEKTAPNESPAALLAAAKLSRMQQLSAKATQYLARSLTLAPNPAALQTHAELSFANGDFASAAQAWRQAFQLLDA
jgi:uncharacterized protein HemY